MSKIVIIEDNELVARIYERKLVKEGHLVGVAIDGRRGLEMVRQIDPDLVLVDLFLPEFSGVEVIKELRKEARFAGLSIIAYSADSQLLEQVREAEPTKIISKTEISPKEILSEIEELLSSDQHFNVQEPHKFPTEPEELSSDKNAANSEKLKKFLIVEDDLIVSNIVKKTVEKLGYTAVCAMNGRAAYQIISKETNFVAAIFDVNLPVINGMDLVKYMRTEKRFVDTPIIMMTSDNNSVQTQIDSFSSGATFFIDKPFKREVLESIIKMLVNKHSYLW
jgi:DNA-binding response OmpR family regulator